MNLADAAARVFTPDIRWVLPALLALAVILAASIKHGRQRLAAAFALLGAGTLFLLLAAASLLLGLPGVTTAFTVLAHLALWGAGIGALGVLVFDALLPSAGVALPPLVRDIGMAAAYAGAAVTVASTVGANVTGILATSAVVTAVIGLSLQDTLGNLMGGMVLQLEQAFSPGDYVRIGDSEGCVREVRWRQTTLTTYAGNVVVIPNGQVVKSVVTVFGAKVGGNRVRYREVLFPVYYDRSPDEVRAAVEQALRDDPPAAVASEPAPVCALADFQPGHAVYAARFFLKDLSAPGTTDSEVRTRVYYALSRKGIKLSVPQRSIVVHQSDEEVKDASRERDTRRRLAALEGCDIFRALTGEERGVLADRLVAAPFSAGETLTRQGAEAHWLYIFVEGEAEVHVGGAEGSLRRSVARLRAGDFMGEMSLLTGEPRSATVVAVGEVLCYRLDREGFADILRRRPEIAAEISQVLARRRAELEAAKGELSGEVRDQRAERLSSDLLGRIRGIFGL